MNQFLFKHIDNSPLIVFRIIFGALCFFESVGAIFTGWIKRTLIEPEFTFNFIGFEWLQPLPGNGMYYYYAVMGIFSLGIMLGYKYRLSTIGYTILWAGVYFMQKASYNNHYYLLLLLCVFMCFLPANRYASLDVKLNPKLEAYSMPQWCKWIFVIQLFILYTYASIAKFYPDWLDLSFPELLLNRVKNYPIIGGILQQKFMPYVLCYGGILYDGLIIPLLLIKKTRKYAFLASIGFHLFNSVVFQIGIFPYLALSFSLFFFEPELIRHIFLKNKPLYTADEIKVPNYKPVLIGVYSIYFLIQIVLPLRHHFIEDDVLWTEEGHRLSWRMMLRGKQGTAEYKTVNKVSKAVNYINLSDYVSAKQMNIASTRPDVIWQLAQRIKNDFKAKGKDVAVYVDCKISVNERAYRQLTNPDIDIASVKWEPFKHAEWLLPSPLYDKK